MTRPEYWTHAWGADPLKTAEETARLEAAGWDGAAVVDSQCFRPDVWSVLTLCAARTSTLKLATGVTNPITRHPSVCAGAAVTLQLTSGGRCVLAVGRGDSALTAIGAAPMHMGEFEHYLEMLQDYLSGKPVPLKTAAGAIVGAPRDFEKLAIGTELPGSRLLWMDDYNLAKVPLDVIATGPKAIEAGARTADCVVITVGTDPRRLRWGLEVARDAGRKHNKDVKVGAYICVVPHPNEELARTMGSALASTMGRFSVMNRKVVGPATDEQRDTLEKLAEAYDYNAHGGSGSHFSVLTPSFIDDFVVSGTPERCADRLLEIAEMGFDKIVVMPPRETAEPEQVMSRELISSEVLPRLE